MKIGFRTPSVKKSIKARTTGRVKRSLKSSVNPLYGKKGMGLVNDPKKAVYNNIYSKTTVGINNINKGISNPKSNNHTRQKNFSPNQSRLYSKGLCNFYIISGVLIVLMSLLLIIVEPVGILTMLLGGCLIFWGKKNLNKLKKYKLEFDNCINNNNEISNTDDEIVSVNEYIGGDSVE